MKNILLVLMSIVLLISCECSAPNGYSSAGEYLKGEHKLVPIEYISFDKIKIEETTTEYLDGYDIKYKTVSKPIVTTTKYPIYYKVSCSDQLNITIHWIDVDGNTQETTVPFNKVSVEKDYNIKEPFVRFSWSPGNDKFLDKIIRIVIVINDDILLKNPNLFSD